MSKPQPLPPISRPSDRDRRRAGRNLALGGALLLFVVLVFVITIVKLKGA